MNLRTAINGGTYGSPDSVEVETAVGLPDDRLRITATCRLRRIPESLEVRFKPNQARKLAEAILAACDHHDQLVSATPARRDRVPDRDD